jgi:hypothetical protein
VEKDGNCTLVYSFPNALLTLDIGQLSLFVHLGHRTEKDKKIERNEPEIDLTEPGQLELGYYSNKEQEAIQNRLDSMLNQISQRKLCLVLWLSYYTPFSYR